MKTDSAKIKRILEILDLDIKLKEVSLEEKKITNKIKIASKDLNKILHNYIKVKFSSIKADINLQKVVEIKSFMDVSLLLLKTEEKVYLLGPFVRKTLKIDQFAKFLEEQDLALDREKWTAINQLPYLNEKKYIYLLELLLEDEYVNIKNRISIYKDTNFTKDKKIKNHNQNIAKELLEKEKDFVKDLELAVEAGELNRLEMIYDLEKNHKRDYKLLNSTNDRIFKNYLNDYLYTKFNRKEEFIFDNLWQEITRKIDNIETSKQIAKSYSQLFRELHYKNKQAIIKNSLVYIDDNLREKIGLDDMAKELRVNKSYLSSIFKKDMKISLVDYIQLKRVENAKYLLEKTDFAISEVAEYVGYSDSAYFIRIFKKISGVTPLKYKSSSKKFTQKIE